MKKSYLSDAFVALHNKGMVIQTNNRVRQMGTYYGRRGFKYRGLVHYLDDFERDGMADGWLLAKEFTPVSGIVLKSAPVATPTPYDKFVVGFYVNDAALCYMCASKYIEPHRRTSFLVGKIEDLKKVIEINYYRGGVE